MQDIASVNPLQFALFTWIHWEALFLHDLILILPQKKTLHFLQKVTPRHIFSCWESLECHRSYSPAGLTCFVGNETVGLAGTPGQHNPIRKQRHLSICPLCFPTYPSSTILSSPFTGFQAVCFTSSAKPGSCQACYGCGRAYYLPAATIVVVGFVELAGLALQI